MIFLEEDIFYNFDIKESDSDQVVGFSECIYPNMLISSYIQGVFPWPDESFPYIPWVFMSPRCVLFPSKIHISKSMKKLLNKKEFYVKLDSSFSDVIEACSQREEGTWINEKIKKAYIDMYNMGFAHSVEVYDLENNLIGGLYGLAIGKTFCGESMFFRKSGASKIALIYLSKILEQKGFYYIDCQQETEHILTMGAETINYKEYKKLLKKNEKNKFQKEKWNIKDFNL